MQVVDHRVSHVAHDAARAQRLLRVHQHRHVTTGLRNQFAIGVRRHGTDMLQLLQHRRRRHVPTVPIAEQLERWVAAGGGQRKRFAVFGQVLGVLAPAGKHARRVIHPIESSRVLLAQQFPQPANLSPGEPDQDRDPEDVRRPARDAEILAGDLGSGRHADVREFLPVGPCMQQYAHERRRDLLA